MTIRDAATIVAVLLSLTALLRSRRLDKRDLFLKMHENLLDPMPVGGRRLIYTIKDSGAALKVIADEDQ